MMHIKTHSRNRRTPAHRRGSVVAYMFMVLMVMVGGVVVATTTGSAVQAQISSLQSKRDQAYFAAETGIQRAMYETEYGTWQYSVTYPSLSGSTGSYNYVVTAAGGGWNTPVVVTSVGTYASDTTINCAVKVTLTPKN